MINDKKRADVMSCYAHTHARAQTLTKASESRLKQVVILTYLTQGEEPNGDGGLYFPYEGFVE